MRALLRLAAFVMLLVAVFALWPGRGLAPSSAPLPALSIADLSADLAEAEARFDDLREGTAKQIIWAGEAGTRSEWAVIYLHGFSASRDEIRPVPDQVAEALNANLYFARLAGHGRSDEAMAEASAEAWMADTREALAIGQALGEKVLVIGTSTGGTLAALAATDPAYADHIDGIVFISPNFSIGALPDYLLNRPLLGLWAPLVLGESRGFEPGNAETERVWTYSYPVAAIFPLGPVLTEAKRRDPAQASMPALFIYSDADQVVDPSATQPWLEGWGGGAERMAVSPGEGIEPQTHVVAGDIRSPALTGKVVTRITQFVAGLE